VYDPIDFSAIFTEPIPEPSQELITQVNYIIEDTLMQIVQDNRGYTAPIRWSAKKQMRISRQEENNA
jgi:hypothetical protein